MIAGTNVISEPPAEPATLDVIDRAMAAMRALGPVPFFISSHLFPPDAVAVFEGDGRKYVCASPGVWAKIGEECGPLIRDPRVIVNKLYDIEIVNIDLPHNRQLRADVLTAWARAMGLPA